MNVHFLQHVSFEGLGYIQTWLEGEGAEISGTRFFAGEALPEPDGLDLIIVMGGPMSVNDESEYPWLRGEKAFLREAVGKGIPVLGVCLGAQLIANALGARVYRSPYKEIGWFPIEPCAAPDTFSFPAETMVLHWHGETFDLPAGAVRLARSSACQNQAFQLGRRVVGLQFHLEMTPEGLGQITANCRDELVQGPYVQTEKALREAPLGLYMAAHSMMGDLLSYLVR